MVAAASGAAAAIRCLELGAAVLALCRPLRSGISYCDWRGLSWHCLPSVDAFLCPLPLCRCRCSPPWLVCEPHARSQSPDSSYIASRCWAVEAGRSTAARLGGWGEGTQAGTSRELLQPAPGHLCGILSAHHELANAREGRGASPTPPFHWRPGGHGLVASSCLPGPCVTAIPPHSARQCNSTATLLIGRLGSSSSKLSQALLPVAWRTHQAATRACRWPWT